MEEDQELKFVCKLCTRKFPCGKSLGGHMRSHVVSNSSESDEKFIFEKKISSSSEFANGQTSYGLRENPRKTWRATDANSPLPLEKICKQCGKGFQSLKALCGHMACHSDKDKGSRDDHSWSTSENQKLVEDSQSDTEAEDRALRTRSSSKIKKIKKIVFLNNNNNNGPLLSVSEIDGDEQEEVAMSLMLLSRDSGNNNSFVESSDNNSVILETKSSSIDMRVGKKNGAEEKHGSEDIIIARAENSDSGYFLDECVKAESDVSVDGYRKNRASFSQYSNYNNKELTLASNPSRIKQGKKRPALENPEPVDVSEKRAKYECFNCKKAFKSYQALGGHRPCHKRTNAFYESRYESGENSLDESTEFVAGGKVFGTVSNGKSSKAKKMTEKKTKANTNSSKKNKGHVCPFCDRVFKNGQALGGHKRSHFIGGHEDYHSNINNNRSPEKKKPDLLDLNLPAPQDDDEDDGNERFLAEF